MSSLNAEIKAAIDAFDLETARALLRDAMQDPDGETYYLASRVALDDEQKENFLEKAVALDPFHEKARQALKALTTDAAPVRKQAPVYADAQPAYAAATDKPKNTNPVNADNLQAAIWTAVFGWTGASFLYQTTNLAAWFTFGESDYYFWLFVGYVLVGMVGGYIMGLGISKLHAHFTNDDALKMSVMVGIASMIYYFLRQIDPEGQYTWMVMNLLGISIMGGIIWYFIKDMSSLKMDTGVLQVVGYFFVYSAIALVVFEFMPTPALPTDRSDYLGWVWQNAFVTMSGNFIGAVVAMNLLFRHWLTVFSTAPTPAANPA